MATLLFAGIGSAIGASVGGTFLGVSAAVIGRGVGAIIGRAIDSRLTGGLSPIHREGQRLENLDVLTSQEGAPLMEINGRAAIAGEVIWAAKLKETANVTTTSTTVGSGKNKQTQTTTTTNYSYSASFAISLGEGIIPHYGRIWANGKLIDLSTMVSQGRVRFYTGDEAQMPDPLIEAIEGGAPAYRGTAYIVFEDLPLDEFGNRVPQIKVEVFGRSGEMETLVKGVNIIPGSTEFGYHPTVVRKLTYAGGNSIFDDADVISEKTDNAARNSSVSDWQISMDQLDALMPEADTASLVVAWFGTDLRAGLCEIEPRVELRDKQTDVPWIVSGLNRQTANLVSTAPNGRPAFGSAPNAASVIAAIQDLRARGKRVVLYPFIMMDITDAQALPHPSFDGTQGAYPWRGRIEPRSDMSVADEIAGFVGSATAAHYSDVHGYTGPNERKYRRFILDLAWMARQAGGVDAFLIGTELRGLTMASDTPGVYPFVDALVSLAADVRQILPDAKISYAADWSEYHSHQTGGDLRFHLDPLWSDANIDFVGIDNYLPLADWRPGITHADLDNEKGHTSPYNLDYLKGNIEGGEYWDWFYLTEEDRTNQVRTPITDGAYGEPWVYRQKAIRDWHANAHHERVGGVREVAATDWVPGSKPIWFTELGCPAVDNGANRPNVFFAANSSEGALPWFSSGVRDDFIQRQFLRASLEWWRDNGAGVVDINDIQVWCWDARPWPEFPLQTGIWSDGPDWFLGHWLNGRAGTAPAAEAIARRLTERHNLTDADFDVSACYGQADGYPVSAPLGFRDFMQPFEVGLAVQAHERDGKLVVESRAAAITSPEVVEAVMVDMDGDHLFTAKMGAPEDVSGVAVLRFTDGLGEYTSVSTRAIIGAGKEEGTSTAETPLVLDFDRGTAATERLLRSAADGRDQITFALPRSATHVRPGVVLPVRFGGQDPRPMIVERVVEGTEKKIEAKSYNYGGYAPTGGVFRPATALAVSGSSSVVTRFLDLPILPGSIAEEWDALIAFHADPWPSGVSWARSASGGSGFGLADAAPVRSTMGETVTDLAPDGPAVWSAATLTVRMHAGSLVTRPALDVLNGANALAVEHPTGWEVMQFTDAQLVGESEWRLTGLLRGRLGSETVIGDEDLPAGASVVVLDASVNPLGLGSGEIGLPRYYRIGPSGDDPATHNVRPFTGFGVGRRPYAPCHLTAVIDGSGDMSVSWIRRTRVDGEADWLDGVEDVPLGEVTERYAVEIIKDGALALTTETTSPAYTYTAAMSSADGIVAPYTLRVAQISETYGPGGWSEIEIS